MDSLNAHGDPSDVMAEEGDVIVEGPNGVAVTLTPEAAEETARRNKRCILLWMNGGASQIDTFDMKPGRPTAGPFREIKSKLPGYHVCEYLPKMAQLVDRLAIIRSMKTGSPDHPDGIYHMHSCYVRKHRRF